MSLRRDQKFSPLRMKIKHVWPINKLGEVAEIIMGQSPPSFSYNERGEGLPFFQGKAEFGDIYPTPIKYCTAPSRIAEKDDILISVRAPVGSINLTREKSATGRGLSIIRAKQGIAEQMLLYYFLRKLEKNWGKLSFGSTFTAIRRESLEKLEVPLPPLRIQKQIVERLNKIAEARKLNDDLIQKAAELFLSLLHKELNSKFKIQKLSQAAEIIMGQSPPSSSYNENGKGLPFFQGKAEFGETYPIPIKYCSSPSRIAEANDILMSVRAPVGNINLAKERSCVGRGLAALHAKENILNQMFLYYFMKKNENNWSRLSVGSTFSAIRRNNLENFEIPLPPMEIQNQIVDKLSAVQEYKKQLIEQKAKLKELFDSVLHKSMKGEL